MLTQFANEYVKAAAVFHCPSDQDPVPDMIETADYTLPRSARTSYDFYSVFWMPEYGPKLNKLNDAPVAWDLDAGSATPTALQNHGTKGGNVVFADGHAEWQKQAEWDDGNWPHPAASRYLP